MSYQLFLDLATELGYRLAICGAETYRVEESVKRLLGAYGISCEAYSVPYSLTVTIDTPEGTPLIRMRRIENTSSDLDAVERYTGLSRRICSEKPDPHTAFEWLKNTDRDRTHYSAPMEYLGHFLGSAGFGWFYGGSFIDALCAGISGLVCCAAVRFLSKLQINKFFSTIVTAFLMALPVYILYHFGIGENPDASIIGALMILVPGLLFTNSMRDLIFGDTHSGIIRIAQVLLIAVSIALGTGSALSLYTAIFKTTVTTVDLLHSVPVMILACAIGCAGFSIYFNVHGPGILICTLGGVLTWGVFAISTALGCGEYMAYFIASAFASLFAEVMARVRKFPAIAYLVVSAFPLLPGGGIYYTMSHAVQGDMVLFSQQGMQTVSIAGAMAVGILLVSTFFRFLSTRKQLSRKI